LSAEQSRSISSTHFPASKFKMENRQRRVALDVLRVFDYRKPMQRVALILLAIGTAVAGGLSFHYHSELSARDARIAALTAERDAARGAEKSALDETAPLRENVERLTAERDRLKAGSASAATDSAKTAAAPANANKNPEGAKGMMSGMAKMFQTEDGKKMLRSQTAMVVKMQYGDLARKLNLSQQDADQIMGLLADRQTALAGNSFAAMSGGTPDDAKLKEITDKATATRSEYDAKLKAVLGDDGFAQLQTYDKSIGERMMLSQIEPQFSAAGSPLDPGQKDQLLQIMSAERQNSPPSPFAAGNNDPAAAMSALKDEAAVDKWMQQEQDYQRRVLQAATATLNPDQINTLQQGFQQMTEMQKFGLKMSREMFNGSGPANATIQVTPAPR